MGKAIVFCFIVLCNIQWTIGQSNIPRKSTELKSLAFGVDVSSPIGRFLEKGWENYEFSFTAGSIKNIFLNVEAGVMDYSISKKEYDNNATSKYLNMANASGYINPAELTIKRSYNYNARGKYFKVGADYNLFGRNLPGEQNIIFIGLRYGFSNTSHKADNIFIQDTIWAPRIGSLPESSMNSHWMEVTSGLRVQFNSFFSMGWSLRFKIMLSPREQLNKPYFIAGYGKSNSNTGFGITYSLFFTLPLFEN